MLATLLSEFAGDSPVSFDTNLISAHSTTSGHPGGPATTSIESGGSSTRRERSVSDTSGDCDMDLELALALSVADMG